MRKMDKEPVIIDATNLLAGRLASHAAKLSLDGRQVVILNTEKAVISGKKKKVLEEMKMRLNTRTLGSQDKAPTHPRQPDRIMKRIVRGMLPWDKPRGKEAFRRVRTYIGSPAEFQGKNVRGLEDADASKLKCKYVTLAELAAEIGGGPP